jgi:hypothetical protein
MGVQNKVGEALVKLQCFEEACNLCELKFLQRSWVAFESFQII